MRLLQNLHHYDLLTFDWCLKIRFRQQLTQASRWISKSADGHLYVISSVLLIFTPYHQIAALLVAAFLLERALYLVMKTHFRRNRPPQAIPGYKSEVEPSDQFSFPSGHTSAAFLFATLISAIAPWMAWVLYPWAASVGISRVMLGVHFPTDTVAGALLGFIIASTALAQAGLQ